MRTLFLLSVSFFAGSPAFASHFIQCELEAKVVDVKSFARLDGAAVFTRIGTNDHEQTVTLEVTRIIRVDGRDRSCLPLRSRHTLGVKQAQLGNYRKEQVLRLEYRNVGDRPGSRISWDVKN